MRPNLFAFLFSLFLLSAVGHAKAPASVAPASCPGNLGDVKIRLHLSPLDAWSTGVSFLVEAEREVENLEVRVLALGTGALGFPSQLKVDKGRVELPGVG